MSEKNKTGNSLPRFRTNATTKAIMSKLTPDNHSRSFVRHHGEDGVSPLFHSLGKLSSTITSASNDAENIFATLPDTELTMMVVVSAIVSPNDMRSAEFTWSYDVPEISPEMGTKLLNIITEYFEGGYDLKKMLPKALEAALFKTGSYPLIVVPESSVDDMINGRTNISKESLSSLIDDKKVYRSRGILGPNNRDLAASQGSRHAGIESMLNGFYKEQNINGVIDKHITVTDNIDVLKTPLMFERQRELALRNKHAPTGLESLYDIGNLEKAYRQNRSTRHREMVRVQPSQKATRAPIGHPMVILAPSDAIIPVHRPSAPEDHLGYYLLLDEMGYPLSNATDSNYYQQLKQLNRSKTDEATSGLLRRSSFLTEGSDFGNNDTTLDALNQSYALMLEKDLLERLRNGIYGEAVDIERPEEVYRIMLARVLSQQRTQLLYVPAELVTYFAFDYNTLGIGISLLEKSKFLAGIRSMLTYATLMGQLSNSVPRRNITITPDETDMEVDKTIDLVMNEYQRINNSALSFDGGKPLDIINGIRNANTSVNVVGNPAFPETQVSVEDNATNRQLVDMSFDEEMTKRHGMALGVTPDLIDSTANIEFAVQSLNSNLLFTKRNALHQETAEMHLVDHVCKYTRNSGALMTDMIKAIRELRTETKKKDEIEEQTDGVTELMDGVDFLEPTAPDGTTPPAVEEEDPYAIVDLKKVVKDKAAEEGLTVTPEDEELSELAIIDRFLETLSIKLPAPDSTKLANQVDLYSQYVTAVDTILPAYVNPELLEYKMGDEGRDAAPMIITLIKSYFHRKFLSQNGIMPELLTLISPDGEEEELLNIMQVHEQHLDSLGATIGALLDAIVAKRRPPEEEVGGDDYSSGGDDMGDSGESEGGDADGGADADLGDMGDFDLPDDLDLNLDLVSEGDGEAEAPAEEPAAAEAEAAPAETPAEPAAEPAAPAEAEEEAPAEPAAEEPKVE